MLFRSAKPCSDDLSIPVKPALETVMRKSIGKFIRTSFLLVAFFTLTPVARALEPVDLLAGFADADISPELGMEQPGGYGKSFHRSFHDACKARAAVFDDGKKIVALVGLDALGIDRRSVIRVRREIASKTNIPQEAVLIGASHSHSSGPVGMVMPGDYDHGDDLVKKLAYQESSMADLKYLEKMESGIADAVIRAWKSRRKVQAGIEIGRAHV